MVELGEFAGGVEVTEPVEGLKSAVTVVGEVETVEFLQRLPTSFETGVFIEQRVETGLVGVVELVASAQQQEPGFEHFWIEHGGDTGWLAALNIAAHSGESSREPSDYVEPVQHMTGLGQTSVNGGLVGFGSVADDDFDPSTPLVGLRHQKPSQRSAVAMLDHRQHLAGVAVLDHCHIAVAFTHRCLITDNTRQR